MQKELESKYKTKAKDSFKTKLKLFFFSLAINNQNNFIGDDFKTFEIDKELVTLYSAVYWQQPRKSFINGVLIDDIYAQMKKMKDENKPLIITLEKEYINSFSKIFSEEDFEKLLSAKTCHYCGLSLDESKILVNKQKLFSKNERGRTLEIDRLNSNLEYNPKNCVMACYWCNNAKTDEFTEEEFLKIGEVIKIIWEERLK